MIWLAGAIGFAFAYLMLDFTLDVIRTWRWNRAERKRDMRRSAHKAEESSQ